AVVEEIATATPAPAEAAAQAAAEPEAAPVPAVETTPADAATVAAAEAPASESPAETVQAQPQVAEEAPAADEPANPGPFTTAGLFDQLPGDTQSQDQATEEAAKAEEPGEQEQTDAPRPQPWSSGEATRKGPPMAGLFLRVFVRTVVVGGGRTGRPRPGHIRAPCSRRPAPDDHASQTTCPPAPRHATRPSAWTGRPVGRTGVATAPAPDPSARRGPPGAPGRGCPARRCSRTGATYGC